MRDHKHAGAVWSLRETGGGALKNEYTFGTIHSAILMDIRDELQTLNSIMRCSNVAKGFRALAKMAARDERAFKRRVSEAARKRIARAK